ncbi:low affinity iron permease family protein [Cytophagaceae bacterium DM2B3-1]|uniref:Low affinity iron permease family protein n=1 Tax=Xanthocytophaga flava TaxID=3048013 RepID=A0ABT7CCH1_9BACT|nr:low affinity iron permease family protein [Xanthocytophaga flavus]MDJ1491368.1 low affinity iron permease family protein [Xanthocytophaga flavus]
MEKPENRIALFFEKFANKTTQLAGSSGAFTLALLTIIIWLATGPIFHYSDTWQLIINTGTTIITFLMVFLIQKSQNKDGMAMQLKLNELIAASQRASNRLVDVESLTEQELRTLSQYYATLADVSSKATNIHESHSIEEAIDDTKEKLEFERQEDQKKAQKEQSTVNHQNRKES